MERRSAQCYGCGVRVQLKASDAAGYIDPERYAKKLAHHQLSELLCARCEALAHGAMVNAVEGQGMTGRDARGLVSQDELLASLKSLKDQAVLVLLLVDLTDLSGTFLGRLRESIGGNPVLAVGTKADLLPRDADRGAVRAWLADELGRRGLQIMGAMVAAPRCKDERKAAVGAIAGAVLRERKGRDVYVVGASNVGKSTFCRALLGALRNRGDFIAQAGRLPVASAMPGTTLGAIRLQAFGPKSALYDTPGVVLSHRLNSLLDGADIDAITPRKPMRALLASAPRLLAAAAGVKRPPYVVDLPAGLQADTMSGLSAVWGGLVRVDVLAAPPGLTLGFVGPAQLRLAIHTGLVGDDNDIATAPEGGGWIPSAQNANTSSSGEPHREDAVEPPGSALVAATGGLRMARSLEFDVPTSGRAHVADLAVSGLSAWVCVTAGEYADERWAIGSAGAGEGAVQKIRLRVWAPKGVLVFSRPSMPIMDPEDAL